MMQGKENKEWRPNIYLYIIQVRKASCLPNLIIWSCGVILGAPVHIFSFIFDILCAHGYMYLLNSWHKDILWWFLSMDCVQMITWPINTLPHINNTWWKSLPNLYYIYRYICLHPPERFQWTVVITIEIKHI